MKNQRNSNHSNGLQPKTKSVIGKIARTAQTAKKAGTRAFSVKGEKKMDIKKSVSQSKSGSTVMLVGRYALLAGSAYLLWRQRGRIASLFSRSSKTAGDGTEENVSMSADAHESEEKDFSLPEQKPGEFRKREKFDQQSNKKPALNTVPKDPSAPSQAV